MKTGSPKAPDFDGLFVALVRFCVAGSGIVICLAGGIILLDQIVGYLKNGVWETVSVIVFLQHFLAYQWLVSPDDWIGVWKLLNVVPASLALVILGCWIGVAGASIE